MRLRLSIQRNDLPKVQILWNVPEDEKAGISTVSKLLEQINDIIPLEAADWGLEDYVVSIGGFECLHFSRIDQILKDEDVVSIRPLTTMEVRSRARSGRTQISQNGQHLVDGIPFGKSYIKQPTNRPPVSIPAQDNKQSTQPQHDVAMIQQFLQLLDSPDDDDGLEDEMEGRAPIVPRGFIEALQDLDDASDDDYDDDFEPDENSDEELEDIDDSTSSEGPDEESNFPAKRSVLGPERKPRKRQKTADRQTETGQSDSSGSNDMKRKKTIRFNEVVDVDASGQEMLTGSSDEKETEGTAVGDKGASLREETPEPEARKSKKRKRDSSKIASAEERRAKPPKHSKESTPRSPSTAEVASKPDASVKAGKNPTQILQTLPGEGLKATQERNARRRKKKKLSKLVENGTLPLGSTYADLTRYLTEQETTMLSNAEDDSMFIDEQTTQSEPNEVSDSQIEPPSKTPIDDDGETSPAKPNLKTSLSEQASEKAGGQNDDAGLEEQALSDLISSAETASRRSRLDVAITRRLVFGSLGVRNPKSKEDEDRLRKQLANPPKVGPHIGSQYIAPPKNLIHGNAGNDAEKPQNDGLEGQGGYGVSPESDAWRSKIKLMAVECIDDDVTLSEPPYPFEQSWDEQFAWNKPSAKKRKKKSKKRNQDVEEEEEEEEHVSLNYDEIAEEIDEDLYPCLPANVTNFPNLTVTALDHPGYLIAFKELEVNNATNWMPSVSKWKLARVISANDKALTLQLAPPFREVPTGKLRFNSRGQFMGSKFESFMDSDGEDEETLNGIRYDVEWQQLMEPRLLLPRTEDRWHKWALSAEAQRVLDSQDEVDKGKESEVTDASNVIGEGLDECNSVGEEGQKDMANAQAVLKNTPPDVGLAVPDVFDGTADGPLVDIDGHSVSSLVKASA